MTHSPLADRKAAVRLSLLIRRCHGVDNLSDTQLQALGQRIVELQRRVSIARSVEGLPSDAGLIREIEALEKTLERLSYFVTGDVPAKNWAVNIIERSHITNGDGDTVSVSEWFDLAPKIKAAAKENISLLKNPPERFDNRYWPDIKQALPAGYTVSTKFMGEVLVELFEEIYPNVPFGGRKDGVEFRGAGFTFVKFMMKQLGYQIPTGESINEAIKRMLKR